MSAETRGMLTHPWRSLACITKKRIEVEGGLKPDAHAARECLYTLLLTSSTWWNVLSVTCPIREPRILPVASDEILLKRKPPRVTILHRAVLVGDSLSGYSSRLKGRILYYSSSVVTRGNRGGRERVFIVSEKYQSGKENYFLGTEDSNTS